MKKSIILTASCVLVASIVWMIILSNNRPLEADLNISDASKPEAVVYTVKDYQGKVAVFKNQEELQEVFDTEVSGLPEMDQQSLREGIIVYSQTELDRLIEAFTS